MDQASIIVTALATGAAAALKPTAEKIIQDAYEGIKSLIVKKFSSRTQVDLLESDPKSKDHQTAVREELINQNAADDCEVLTKARELLDLVTQYAPDVPETIGIRLQDVQGASLKLRDIASSGSGVRVTGAKMTGNIEISGVRAGNSQPTPNVLLPGLAGRGGRGSADRVDIHLDHVESGDMSISGDTFNTQVYLVQRGITPYQDYLNGVLTPGDIANQGTIEVDALRKQLLRVDRLPNPIAVTVRGTLFPCALLTAGWWDRQQNTRSREPVWRNNIQKWLFHGFDLWGPSWDFTWVDLHDSETRYVIAQLGSGDEADSIPVLIPREIAVRLEAYFGENWGGGEVEVTGLLGHRRHFSTVHRDVDLIGGLLDYCIWIDHNNTDHLIEEINEQTEVYSGYVWKCVATESSFNSGKPLKLNDVYFVWEHTNFRDSDAIKYNLDSLLHKEQYIAKSLGPLVLLQKASNLVPGTEAWNTREFYNVFVNKKKRIV